jgi:hypothetical protein
MLGLLGIGDNAAGGIDTGDIGHSLRFRRSASSYIATGVTTAATSTYFAFFKQGALDAINPIFDGNIKINANNTVTAFGLTTSAVKRDPTSHHWIHVSNNGLVIDGQNLGAVTTSAITNLRIGYDGTNYADMYGSRMCCVSGTSLPYTDFVTFNSTINEWVVKSKSAIKALVDAGGAASFMYEFDDASSLTTLGNDYSSKNNDATLNNFSLTAGTTYDWMLDVPGNSYATLNPLDYYGTAPINGNLTFTKSAGVNALASATWLLPTGKWYWEVNVTTVRAAALVTAIGISGRSAQDTGNNNLGTFADQYAYLNGGNKINNSSSVAYGAAYTSGDVIGIAYDADAGTLVFYKNNTSQGTAYSSIPSGSMRPMAYSNGDDLSYNFGQRPFADTPPTGFKALCQANLPTPAILNPKEHFDVKLDTGANIKTTSEAVFPSNFFEWIKDRGNSNNHQLIDIVRGSSAVLQSNTTAAETTYSAPSGSSVGWVWKAGGAAVTNNAGSISSQVSANVEAGFSIVTWDGNGNTSSGETIGHGLSKILGMFITKKRNAVGTDYGWSTWHKGLSSTNGIWLEQTSAQNPGMIAASPVSSTTFIPFANDYNNVLNATYITYCFAEIPGFSKIDSVVMNSSTDGANVDCDFKPKYILAKRIDSTSDWFEKDSVRNPYNVATAVLSANTSSAEASSGFDIDFTSRGFKIRTSLAGTYIFYAVADVAAKYSLAR